MTIKNKIIVDERQELQSINNAKNAFMLVTVLLGISVVIQSAVYSFSPSHYLPELIILLAGCFFNIFMDIKQGNLYTSDTQNFKKNHLLYVFTSLGFSLIISVGNYIQYDFPAWKMLIILIPVFLIMLGLMFTFDYFYRKAAKSRILKIEKKLASESEDND